MIDQDLIKKAANLARLEIQEADMPKLSKQISDIIQYVETLNELNLEGIKPTAHAVDVDNVFRSDKVVDAGIIEEVLEQAPEHEGRFFRVPKVL